MKIRTNTNWIYQQMHIVFTTELFERRVYEGRAIFEDPLESFEAEENTKEYEFSSGFPTPIRKKYCYESINRCCYTACNTNT
ncbi:unnamed protein product [Parnassius apollo]|uniref:(apollo) hypothetical protein n=1 Tax=Parnassius apollo TaxID=110799 RepID=A0A8S3WDX3_PARAO|nr:unnamed protein product [Parnassius apollo]